MQTIVDMGLVSLESRPIDNALFLFGAQWLRLQLPLLSVLHYPLPCFLYLTLISVPLAPLASR